MLDGEAAQERMPQPGPHRPGIRPPTAADHLLHGPSAATRQPHQLSQIKIDTGLRVVTAFLTGTSAFGGSEFTTRIARLMVCNEFGVVALTGNARVSGVASHRSRGCQLLSFRTLAHDDHGVLEQRLRRRSVAGGQAREEEQP